MMRLKVFNTLALLFVPMALWAQFKISGKVLSQESQKPVQNCIVYLNEGAQLVDLNSRGEFVFENLKNGTYTLHFTSESYKYKNLEVQLNGKNESVTIYLETQEQELGEAVITESGVDFGLARMRGIENMGLYEGKKSEVIIPENMTANLATNNARQVYSKVAGLNIWENDGAGIQLSIGGRGLDPNRTSNFNTRQNGYDISADALGYPESYYTPPMEAIEKIQIVRGAASLQYGTQFGGLINFVMKQPVEDKKFEFLTRQTGGSFGFYNGFFSGSGTVDKLSYYAFYQFKRGDGWRPNSEFENHNAYLNLNYQISEKTKIGIDLTKMNYLAQQPGGLSDDMFDENPRQSNRERNWFYVDWNLWALHLDHQFDVSNSVNLRVFGLDAKRYSVGFRPNRVATIDDGSERDLIKGEFQNWGAEARYLHRYQIGGMQSIGLVGTRYYHGFNHSRQGFGSKGSDAGFEYIAGEENIFYDYRFPNRNGSVFIENILYVNEKFSITPGLRFEKIKTTADGYYGNVYRDLAGNIIEFDRQEEYRVSSRQFVIGGIGFSFKPNTKWEAYANASQNYRSITFSDMRISNPSSVIDQNLEDEKGYSIDMGIRSEEVGNFNYDLSFFLLNYNNRIGEVQFYDESNRVLRKRTNIGQALIRGLEFYGEWKFTDLILPKSDFWNMSIFSNVALIDSEYKKSEVVGVKGNRVEFVPTINFKAGAAVMYKKWRSSLQYAYLSEQFTDATNATSGGVSAVVGVIRPYGVLDFSTSYSWSKFKLEGSINNLANAAYFTRRATGYPGPGILPSDGRGFYLTFQYKL